MSKKFLSYIILFLFIFNIDGNSKSAPSSFANLAEKLMPSVVNISTTQTITTNKNTFPFQFPPGSPFEDMFKDFGTPQTRKSYALGSGFIIDKKGIVITNNHVIQGADDIIVTVNGDKEYNVKVIGADPLSDIAVLQIDTQGIIPEGKDRFLPVSFGDSDKARIGDWVLAIGNPFGFGGTVTAGIISARNRNIGLSRYEDFIQTDASINSGNSGGPLFNMNGDVIGINTAILGQSGSIGIGFAIPSNSAEKVIDQLIKYGETKRGWLGVRIQIVTKEIAEAEGLDRPRGAFVVSVADGSPSDKGGIVSGDIILNFDGKKINEMKELPLIVAQTEVGKTVSVKVWRNKREVIKKITLGRLETSKDFNILEEKPQYTSIEGLKIKVRPIYNSDIVSRKLPKNTMGVMIVQIDSNSPINYLNVENIIIEADGKKIKTPGDLKNIVNAALKRSDKAIEIVIINNLNQRRSIGVKLD